jgi:very-short-patch-repair endonuclease
MSELEDRLLIEMIAWDLPEPEREFRFHAVRRWRFDFAWPDRLLAVEVDGGQWTRGRHMQAQGAANDNEKYNEAQLAGWRVLRFATDQVKDGSACQTVRRAFVGAKSEERKAK